MIEAARLFTRPTGQNLCKGEGPFACGQSHGPPAWLPAICLFAFAAFAFLHLVPAAAEDQEWKLHQQYRRAVTGGGNADTAVCHFFGGGHVAPAGKDVVVLDEAGKVVPSEVLLTQGRDSTWVAYQASKAMGPVTVYYGGGRRFKSDKRKWQPKLSLMLLTMPLPPGALKSYQPIAETAQAKRVYGMGFVPNIWHALNPYGPDDDYASLYIGILNIRRPGKYRLFTVSDEASYVVLDGKLAFAWPGRHTFHRGARGEKGKDVQLTRGLHKIEYYHAEKDGPQYMALGWKPPGKKRFEVVPESAFIHTPVAKVGPPERKADKPLAGFEWEQVDQFLYENHQFTRIEFKSLCKSAPLGGALAWNFGDGQETTDAVTQHVFLGDGPFLCKLTLLDGDGHPVDWFQRTIEIEAALRPLTLRNRRQLLKYVQTVAHYSFKKLNRTEMDTWWDLLEIDEDAGLIQPFTKVYVDRFGIKGKLWYAADRLAMAYSFSDPEKALKLYGKLAAKAPSDLDKSRMLIERVETIIYKIGDYERAKKTIEALKKSRDELTRQLGMVKEGDILRVQGKYKEAEEVYRNAQLRTYKDMTAREVAVKEGGYLETAAAHVEKGQLRAAREDILKWESEFPMGKLHGDLTLVSAKYFQAVGDHQRALHELSTLTVLNPLSPYLPEIEFRLARSHAMLGDRKKARELLQKVIREYPNSRAAQAAKRVRF